MTRTGLFLTFLGVGLASQATRARPGKDMVLWGSLSLARALITADLVDEYHLQVCPTLLGSGHRLFPELAVPANFERVTTRTYDTGVVFLHYEPRRAT